MEESDNTEIRSDKWLEMDVGNLINQRDIVLNKLMMLQSTSQSVTTHSMSCALQHALNDIDYLLDLQINTTQTTNGHNNSNSMSFL